MDHLKTHSGEKSNKCNKRLKTLKLSKLQLAESFLSDTAPIQSQRQIFLHQTANQDVHIHRITISNQILDFSLSPSGGR